MNTIQNVAQAEIIQALEKLKQEKSDYRKLIIEMIDKKFDLEKPEDYEAILTSYMKVNVRIEMNEINLYTNNRSLDRN